MPIDCKLILDDFIAYLNTEKGLCENTIKSYYYDLNLFLKHIIKKNVELNKIEADHIVEYFCIKIDDGTSYRSLNRLLSTLRIFFKYLMLDDKVSRNPTKDISAPRFAKYLPVVMSPEEVEKLLSFPDSTTPQGNRDKAIIELMYSGGFRISEACRLKLTDIDFEDKLFYIKGKGDKERFVPIGSVVEELLKGYLQNARSFFVKKRRYNEVFLNEKRGSPLTRQGLWFILKKYINMLRLDRNVVPHTLRHSFATHLLSGGADLRSVQDLLGHENLSTTQIYTHVDPKRLKEVHNKFHPLK